MPGGRPLPALENASDDRAKPLDKPPKRAKLPIETSVSTTPKHDGHQGQTMPEPLFHLPREGGEHMSDIEQERPVEAPTGEGEESAAEAAEAEVAEAPAAEEAPTEGEESAAEATEAEVAEAPAAE